MTPFIHPNVAKQREAIIATHNAHNHTFPFGINALPCPCGSQWIILQRRGETARVFVCEKCGAWHSILWR